MTAPVQLPRSLIDGVTAADRRARVSVKAVDPVPASRTGSGPGVVAGFATRGASKLHVTVRVPDAASSFSWQLYLWDATAERWCLDTRPASGLTPGTVTVTGADADNPQLSIIDIGRVPYVWIRCVGATFAADVDGADVWLSGIDPLT